MKPRELEKKLGMDPGRTLTALVALAYEELPESPGGAFGELCLGLPWLEQRAQWTGRCLATPKNVYAFAKTGGTMTASNGHSNGVDD